jgi:hypothetical protein
MRFRAGTSVTNRIILMEEAGRIVKTGKRCGAATMEF